MFGHHAFGVRPFSDFDLGTETPPVVPSNGSTVLRLLMQAGRVL